jgi:hypothetical protein
MLVKMGPEEHFTLRALRGSIPLAEASVPDDAPGAVDAPVVLMDAHGTKLATVRLRGRVQVADE